MKPNGRRILYERAVAWRCLGKEQEILARRSAGTVQLLYVLATTIGSLRAKTTTVRLGTEHNYSRLISSGLVLLTNHIIPLCAQDLRLPDDQNCPACRAAAKALNAPAPPVVSGV